MFKSTAELINAERANQDKKWGGIRHDVEHAPIDWQEYMIDHASKMIGPSGDYPSIEIYRKQLVRVAALAVAALEVSYQRELTVMRDADGFYVHPDFPENDGNPVRWEWFEDHGYEINIIMMDGDAEQEFIDEWFEDGLTNCSPWNPTKPDGEGWFIFSIYDTEDGPCCLWVRSAAFSA